MKLRKTKVSRRVSSSGKALQSCDVLPSSWGPKRVQKGSFCLPLSFRMIRNQIYQQINTISCLSSFTIALKPDLFRFNWNFYRCTIALDVCEAASWRSSKTWKCWCFADRDPGGKNKSRHFVCIPLYGEGLGSKMMMKWNFIEQIIRN